MSSCFNDDLEFPRESLSQEYNIVTSSFFLHFGVKKSLGIESGGSNARVQKSISN